MKDFEIDFNVWDFGGHEVYYDTHAIFLTDKCIYLVVWDVRECVLL
jgi:GTPase SAR1 family protein